MKNINKINTSKNHRQRLYEKIIHNHNHITEKEILEITLFSAHARIDTKPIAARLLQKFKSLSQVLNADKHSLLQIDGIGKASIAAIKTIGYACRILAWERINKKNITKNWDQIIEFCRITIGHQNNEHIMIIFMNANNEILEYEIHNIGTINHIAIYPREIAKKSLELNASAIILAHNHPNNNTNPSNADINISINLKRTLKELDIILHDHIIIAPSGYFSFKHAKIL